MTNYAPLTSGLKHVPQTEELAVGLVCIVRFKDGLNSYRTNLWIGVVLPEGFEPGRNLSRRPKGSKPIEQGSPWTTPFNERAYPMYLPGRNTFRWTNISDLFLLDKKPPSIYSGTDRPAAKLFQALLKIAQKKPGLQFWKDMANKETQAKGKRNRALKLVLPDGHEDVVSDILLNEAFSDDETIESMDESADLLEDTDLVELEASEMPPNKVHARNSSFAASRSTGPSGSQYRSHGSTLLSFPGESTSFLNYSHGHPSADIGPVSVQTSHDNGQHPAVARRTQLPLFPKQTTRNESSQSIAAGKTKVENGDTGNVNEINPNVFSLDLRTALDHVFLQKSDAACVLAVLHECVKIQNKPACEQIRSWLTVREFAPRLIQMNEQSAKETANSESSRRQVGDILGVHRRYHLEAINDSEHLREQILSLGRLYKQARHFEMPELIDLIQLKLQAAWNSYPGVSQLQPILEVVTLAFKDISPEHKHDSMQAWLVNFVADTMDLFFYDCPEHFWEVLRGNPTLHEKVFKIRTEALQKDPAKYADPRVLIRSRGIEKF